MFKIKNKFIIFIITIILGIVITLLYRGNADNNKDLNSYVVLVQGEAKLNDNSINIDDRHKLSVGDTIKTIGNNALAVLEWGDGSVTRLGGNSSMEIKELYISGDLTKMNINFVLLSGKTWSNIISLFGYGSYIKESFRDTEATVRGTVFNLDLDNDYLYVIDHKVDLLSSSGVLMELNKNNPINLKDFTFISLEDFIKSFKDKTFEELNINLDNELLKSLRNRFNKDLSNINKLKDIDLKNVLSDKVKKQELYNKIFTEYQKLNFVKPDDLELFKLKLELKDNLLELSNSENKDILVNSTMYDFKEMLDSKKYGSVDQILGILSKNKEYLKDINLNSYFDNVTIPDDIKNKILDKYSELNNFFSNTFNSFNLIDVGLDDLKKINDKANGLIHDGLNTLFDK